VGFLAGKNRKSIVFLFFLCGGGGGAKNHYGQLQLWTMGQLVILVVYQHNGKILSSSNALRGD